PGGAARRGGPGRPWSGRPGSRSSGASWVTLLMADSESYRTRGGEAISPSIITSHPAAANQIAAAAASGAFAVKVGPASRAGPARCSRWTYPAHLGTSRSREPSGTHLLKATPAPAAFLLHRADVDRRSSKPPGAVL